MLHIGTCGSNNWETVADRWIQAARDLASILRDNGRAVSRRNKNMGWH